MTKIIRTIEDGIGIGRFIIITIAIAVFIGCIVWVAITIASGIKSDVAGNTGEQITELTYPPAIITEKRLMILRKNKPTYRLYIECTDGEKFFAVDEKTYKTAEVGMIFDFAAYMESKLAPGLIIPEISQEIERCDNNG